MSIPPHQQTELRAYQIWQERGEPWGTPEEDWLKAENELAGEDGNSLSNIARSVGAAIGNVVGLLTDLDK